MQKVKIIIAAVALLLGIVSFTGVSVSALDCSGYKDDKGKLKAGAPPACQAQAGVDGAGDTDAQNCTNANGTKRKCTLSDAIKDIVNILLFIIGAVAVIMIVIGGIKYTTSNGDSSAITSAKNTILYSVVGLVIALLAYAIVNFVINQF